MTDAAPERIWLDGDAESGDGQFPRCFEMPKYCSEPAVGYVRADFFNAAQARISELEAALGFYADEKNWEGQFNREPCETHHVFAFQSGPARRDGGRVARRVLEAKP